MPGLLWGTIGENEFKETNSKKIQIKGKKLRA
jgi:hypothetical protein